MKCSQCKSEVHPLEIFPKNLCLACYSQTAEGKRIPTAEELIKMWSK